ANLTCRRNHHVTDRILLSTQRRPAAVSVLFITHDFNLAKSFCKRLAIMFKGMILEDLQDCSPLHPYTKELEKASDILSGKQDPILLKQNNALSCPISIDSGCPYYKRCAKRIPQCLKTMPELVSMPLGHSVRCLNILEI
ncbi:oligopeptide/dipeptide ABC transporter ATP-binding protein, partial [Succinatimonas hippei]|uniref:oligopeptide/dipeptide ABC transporter ATP-binding protein n=1 Tax=Succinatimonas hippei TaxID=626938 RepID=UPI0030B8DADA